MEVYLDNNASTRVCSEARAEMARRIEDYGNPSSLHPFGTQTRGLVESSRSDVATLLGGQPENIIFTSGGTESNNLAILGVADGLTCPSHFVTSSVEHPSVLSTFRHLESRGHSVTYLPVDEDGHISLDDLRRALTRSTRLISLMAANNETGVLFPIAEIGEIAHERGVLFHCDAVQAGGKMPISVETLGVDLLSLSGHKFHGPKGIGALYVRERSKVAPRVHGGGQEGALRSGTEPLLGIVGFGVACKIARDRMSEVVLSVQRLRDRLEQGLLDAIPGSRVLGDRSQRVGNTTNIHFPGVNGTKLFSALCDKKIYVSRGSACSSRSDKGDHVLAAMGLDPAVASASFRFSLSRETVVEEIDHVVELLPRIVADLSDKMVVSLPPCEVPVSPQSIRSVYDRLTRELELVWRVTKGDPEIRIAVLDGPVDLSHPCFRGAALENVPILRSSASRAGAASRHGTMVASILFGQPGSPVHGVAPQCRGMLVPIFDDTALGGVAACSQNDLARAILAAADKGAHLINISGGTLDTGWSSGSEQLVEAVRHCNNAGIVIVAAAGNHGCSCAHLPASLEGVVTVGAMDPQGQALDSSNWGELYRGRGILAPGKDIIGAVPGGGVAVGTGTSYATPYVAGLLGLLLSIQRARNGVAQPKQAVAALLESARACDVTSLQSRCERHLEGELDIASALARLSDYMQAARARTTIAKGETTTFNTRIHNEGEMDMQNTESAVNMPVLSADETGTHRVTAVNDENPIRPSDCSGATQGQMIYALGAIGFDFLDESRRNSFAQTLANPMDHRIMHEHLGAHPYDADSIVWTLNIGGVPVYALRPHGNFGVHIYKRLCETLKAQLDEGVHVVSIPGYVIGSVKIASGAELKIVAPEIRGLYSWSTKALVEKLSEQPATEADAASVEHKSAEIEVFLERVYYEFRNAGSLPQERALNYAATNAFQLDQVFASALREGLVLSSVTVERTPITRSGSDCWDVKLIFFNPHKRTELARKVYRFTVDVSDVVPFMVDKIRSWYLY